MPFASGHVAQKRRRGGRRFVFTRGAPARTSATNARPHHPAAGRVRPRPDTAQLRAETGRRSGLFRRRTAQRETALETQRADAFAQHHPKHQRPRRTLHRPFAQRILGNFVQCGRRRRTDCADVAVQTLSGQTNRQLFLIQPDFRPELRPGLHADFHARLHRGDQAACNDRFALCRRRGRNRQRPGGATETRAVAGGRVALADCRRGRQRVGGHQRGHGGGAGLWRHPRLPTAQQNRSPRPA